MIKGQCLFYLSVDDKGPFDAVKGHSMSTIGEIRNIGDDRALILKKNSYVKIKPSKDLENLETFTIEAKINPKRLNIQNNILEALKPPILLYIHENGKLIGAIHTVDGWETVDSDTNLIHINSSTNVRFTRDVEGILRLEINDEKVGERQIDKEMQPAGTTGFIIGAGNDGKANFFHGTISDLKIRSTPIQSDDIEERKKYAKVIENKVTQLGYVDFVKVNPNLDTCEINMQKIKNLINAVGVDDLSMLSTLEITKNTIIEPGTIMLPPTKMAWVEPNWSNIATEIARASIVDAQKILATKLTNRNSSKIIKSAMDIDKVVDLSVTPVMADSDVTRIRAETEVTRLRTDSSLMRFRSDVRKLSKLKSTLHLSEMVALEGDKVKILNSELIQRMEASSPSSWPTLAVLSSPLLISSNVIPVSTSVIIANKLDLTDKELKIEPTVEKLYIIANEIVCDNKAKITWRQSGRTTPDRADDRDLDGQSYYGIVTKPDSRDGVDGGNGRSGIVGISGANGYDAPDIEIWCKNFHAIPLIEMNGEKGIKGGKGQKGGDGGRGGNGAGGKWCWFFGKHCCSDPGDGGHGGFGGDGRRGGLGGNGGDGSNVYIAVLEDTLDSTVMAQAFRINTQGGDKGDGGERGDGGHGGRGGYSGNGEVCTSADDGVNRADAQPGQSGLTGEKKGNDKLVKFDEFTEDAWNDLLTRPWLSELTPSYAFPGSTVIIQGSRFTEYDRVIIGSYTLFPTIRADETIEVTLPQSISGGEHLIYIIRQDGRESNRLRMWVKPQLITAPSNLLPGIEASIIGRAFLDGASILYNGEACQTNFISSTLLSFKVPGTGGQGCSEHYVTLCVHNPDGMLSNETTAFIPEIREIGFKIGIHDFSFDNFQRGTPSWSTYENTFGELEIYHELIDPVFGHPILTAAFYGFYHYFLKGKDRGGLATGFCTALSAVVLDEFWTGSMDTHARYVLDDATRKRFTGIHGKLLSRETLITLHDQSREGNSRVLTTFNTFENRIVNGCDKESAPLLFFIPCGAAWDEGYFDKLADTHCIVPIRIVYPQNHAQGDPDGVELYCWDCNHPPEDDPAGEKISENCRLKFRRTNGEILFDYYCGSTLHFSSDDGITLGTMSNGEFYYSDHDLPFSGPLGLTSFIIDFILSPAEIQVTDENGFRTGNFGSQILSEIPNSHPCYLAKGAFLLPPDQSFTRRFIGKGDGTYSFHSISSNGTSITLENVNIASDQEDVLSINSDGTQVRFTPATEKQFNLILGRNIDNQIRGVKVFGIGGNSESDIDITLAPDLSIIRVGNRSDSRIIDVSSYYVSSDGQNGKIDQERFDLPVNHDLIVSVTDWTNLTMTLRAIPFE